MSNTSVVTENNGNQVFPSGYYNKQNVDTVYAIVKNISNSSQSITLTGTDLFRTPSGIGTQITYNNLTITISNNTAKVTSGNLQVISNYGGSWDQTTNTSIPVVALK